MAICVMNTCGKCVKQQVCEAAHVLQESITAVEKEAGRLKGCQQFPAS